MAKNSTIYALLTAFGVLTASFRADACTNIIVTRGASTDNSNIISYAADSHVLYGELYFHPAADWKAGSMLDIINWDSYKPMGQIPQIAHTYKTVGNMNEHQLIIAETTWGGRLELEDTTAIMDYGSLIYVALQRARTAREAIQVIVDLANEYGYASEGETFSIADKDEAWIMDLIGKGCEMKDGKNIRKGFVWVAMRIPDGYICSHANQARIQTFPLNDPENCLYAPDVISFAREKGYFDGKDEDFDFSAAYCPADFGTVRGCDARAWSAFNILCDGQFTYEKDGKTMDQYTERVRIGLSYMPYAPVLFLSAKTGARVHKLFDCINDVYEQNGRRIPTGQLNTLLAEATARVQPPTDKGRRLKIYYMTQSGVRPPTFVCFCNDAQLFHFSYQRYLENQIRDVYGLKGTPIRMIVRERGGKEE